MPATSNTNRWTATILMTALAVFVCKTVMAYMTFGTNDVLTWKQDLAKIYTQGPIALYQEGVQAFSPSGTPYLPQEFIHPPFMIHVLQFWGVLVAISHLSLGFWMRFTCALADVGSLIVVWKIGQRLPQLRIQPLKLLVFVTSPVSIFISGFHGNTDPIMIFFLLLSVYSLEVELPALVAGGFMGIAFSIKIVPVILMPAAFLYLRGLRNRIQFVSAAFLVFFVLGWPVTIMNPGLIGYKLLTYSALPGIWGTSLVAWLLFGAQLTFSKVALLASILAVSIGLNWPKPRLPLFTQCGLIFSLFLFLTPGFGVQYLSWLVPWVSCLMAFAAIAYNWAGGIFLFVVYTYWSRGLPWYFANSFGVPGLSIPGAYLGVACWLVTGLILLLFIDLWLKARPEGCDAAQYRQSLRTEDSNTPENSLGLR